METTEKQFEAQVKELAMRFGWLYYHTWRSIRSPAGFPDCVMVKGDWVIFAELKSEKGKVTEPQKEWLDALFIAGEEVYTWRPSQFDDIVKVLRRGSDN